MREVIVVLWSTIVYNIFIDIGVAATGVTGQDTRSTRTQLLMRKVIVILW